MRFMSGISAAALAALAFSSVAAADEAEILRHYDAYETAMSELRYDVADAEAEAAWRAAEAEWGGIEDTAVLAFNLVRLRLMGDYRPEAVEPARRIAELARSGNARSIAPAEVTLFTTLAEFDGAGAGRDEVRALEQALEAYPPTDYVGKRIALLGWGYAANGRVRHGQHYDALTDAQRAVALAAEDPTAPTALVGAAGLIGARAGYETGEIEDGILTAKRAIAAFPVQPAGQPLDPALASLLIWEQGLMGLYFGEERQPYVPADPALTNPKWDDGRYAAEAGCMVTWTEAPAMGGGFGGPRPEGMGAVFEYRLNADGSVADVAVIGAAGEQPFEEALREAKAEPPASEACQGPYYQVNAFLFPKSESSGARSSNNN